MRGRCRNARRSPTTSGLVSDSAESGTIRVMNVVVCVKQIPDPAAPQQLDPTTKNLVRSGKLILDDSDAYGVEMGLQLVDAAGGGEVTIVSIAPGGETSGLRTALAMGAAKAILVSDDALAGSDALSTAKVLAKAIARAEPDLVLAATESTDGYTGTTPVQVAELLGMPSITFAKQVEVDRRHREGRSARPRPDTTRSRLRCRRWSRSRPVWSSRVTRLSRGSWPPSPSRSTS